MAIDQLDSLLKEYDVFEVTDHGKLLCTVTKHELPYRLDAIEQYIKTPKFIKNYQAHKVLSEHGKHFEEFGRGLYGCKLTMRTIAKDGPSLQAHVDGIKFKNALERAKKAAEEAAKKAEEAGVNSEDVEMADESEPTTPKPLKSALKKKSDDAGKKKTKSVNVKKQKIKSADDEKPTKAVRAGEKRKVVSGTRRNATKQKR